MSRAKRIRRPVVHATVDHAHDVMATWFTWRPARWEPPSTPESIASAIRDSNADVLEIMRRKPRRVMP